MDVPTVSLTVTMLALSGMVILGAAIGALMAGKNARAAMISSLHAKILNLGRALDVSKMRAMKPECMWQFSPTK
jgi:hypothetical protein